MQLTTKTTDRKERRTANTVLAKWWQKCYYEIAEILNVEVKALLVEPKRKK